MVLHVNGSGGYEVVVWCCMVMVLVIMGLWCGVTW